ncbi:MAG: ABC transporter transmembrane domain-containing protein [Bacteroidota bacterium]
MAERSGRRGGGGDIDPEDKKRRVDREGLAKLMGIFGFILPHKGYFIAAMLVLFFGIFTTLSFPYLMGELVNSAAPEGASGMEMLGGGSSQAPDALKDVLKSVIPQDKDAIAFLLIGILCVQAVFSFLRVYFSEQMTQRTMADIRYTTYRRLITFPVHFFEKRRVGELTSRLSSDVTQLQDVLSFTLFEFVRQVLILIFGLLILFLLVSAELTLFMLAIIPLVVIGAIIFGRFIRKLSKKTQDELAETNTIVDETLHAILVVKAFASELRETLRYRLGLNKVVKIALRTAIYRGWFSAFIFVVLFGGITAIVWYGATLMQAGDIEIGDLVKFVIYTAFIAGSVAGLSNVYTQLQKTIGGSERILELLNEDTEFELPAEGETFPTLTGQIAFQKVGFNYPSRPDVEVLKDVSFEVKPGQKIALVGQSGAGKSTIAQLIMRLYEIGSGELLIDNQPMSNYSFPVLRSNIGLVPQEVILFGGTIRENISYGKPEATDKEIIAAAEQANAWEFIAKFPEQLETVVGERGVKLSGGQRQRIAIARAILKDPSILILDEATSSLDAESEHLVQGALNKLMEGRTTLIIAHRLSTIRDVDQIYVLDGGKIIEAGTHEQLALQEGGTYNNLLKLQLADA